MAASAPTNWNDLQGGSSGENNDTKGLELGMSGLSMVSNLPSNVNRLPALSGSSISSAPEEHHHRHHSFGSISFPNSDTQNVHGSGPPSPSSPMPRGVIGGIPQHFLPKPPGLSSLPSPIGKSSVNSTAINTLSSSQQLTFTPPSIVGDGLVFQGSPFENNSPWADYGGSYNDVGNNHDADSFDRSEDPDDGLMGLGALRERAQSSPGPITGSMSSSPPVRIDVNPYQGDLSPLPTDGDRNRGLPPDPRRSTRTSSFKVGSSGSSRPPLSGQSASHVDSSFHNFSGRSSPGNINDTSYEYPSFGGRSDMAERLQASSGRSRSITLGSSMGEQHDMNRNAHGEQFRHIQQHQQQQQHHHLDPSSSYTNKFGNLPSLSNVHQQQRHHQMPPQPNRHVRSYSHSGALQQYGGMHEMQDDRRTDQRMQHHQQGHHQRLHSDGSDGMFGGDHGYSFRGMQGSSSSLPRSLSTGDHHSSHSAPSGMMPRSVSMSQAILPQGFEQHQPLQRRNSDFLQGGGGHYRHQQQQQQQMHPSLQRRDEFAGESAPIMATPEELRAFNIHDDRRGSSQQQQRYHSPSQGSSMGVQHHRHHSDYGGARSGGRYGVQNQELRGSIHGGLDDDLTHPLAGEHIDDPGDDLGYGIGSSSAMMAGMHHGSQMSYARNDMSQHMSRSPTGYAVHHSAAPNMPMHRLVYTVKFKRTQRSFIQGPRVSQDLKIGCYVKVEADRGEDLGIVVAKVPTEKFNAAGRASFRPTAGGDMGGGLMGAPMPPSGISDLKRVIRLATHDEVGLLTVKRDEEEELLNICRQKVRQRALPMHVVDAEYQFDRHKLTFFFEAEGRIDFRELVRDLFSIYKTRIWMQQLDKNVPGNSSPAALSPMPNTDFSNQVPVMADSINDPYGIPSDLGAGSTHQQT